MSRTGRRRRDAENRDEVRRSAAHPLVEEQAALCQVATLIAQNVPPEQVFSAVTDAVARVLGPDATMLARWDGDAANHDPATDDPATDDPATDDRATYLSGSGWRRDAPVPVAAPAGRFDDLGELGEGAGVLRAEGVVAGVVGSIVVDGQVWGALSVWSRTGSLPAGTEEGLAGFCDLVGTAVASAEDRARSVQLLEEQAALRRVAVLVARGPSPAEVCSVLADELCGLLGIDDVGVCRFDPDHSALLIAATGDSARRSPVGTRMDLDDHDNRTETPRRYAIWQVWHTGRSARYDAARSDGRSDATASGQRWRDVRSVVACPIVVNGRLWGTVGAWSNHAPLPPDTVERLSSFTELAAMAIGNAQARAELAASRARIVAAADETRRRIERNLHDGAQQRLVTLGLGLRLAQDSVPEDVPELRARIGAAIDEVTEVIEDLREMARGIHPAILSESGLGPALRTLARRSAVPVDLDIDIGMGIEGRFPQPVEVAAYYVVSETITNTAKHARASQVRVAVTQRDGVLELAVRDDGVGGAEPRPGSGLVGLRDRVEAIGGAIEVSSPSNAGTTVLVKLPVQSSVQFTHPGQGGPCLKSARPRGEAQLQERRLTVRSRVARRFQLAPPPSCGLHVARVVVQTGLVHDRQAELRGGALQRSGAGYAGFQHEGRGRVAEVAGADHPAGAGEDHVGIGDPEQVGGDLGQDPGLGPPTLAAQREDIAVLLGECGAERVRRPGPGPDDARVGRIEAERGAAVVQHHPGGGLQQSGAEALEDALDQRHRGAVRVDGGDRDRVARGLRAGRERGDVHVGRQQQRVEIDGTAPRVAEKGVPALLGPPGGHER
jgi:signal transduction histidine kinase